MNLGIGFLERGDEANFGRGSLRFRKRLTKLENEKLKNNAPIRRFNNLD